MWELEMRLRYQLLNTCKKKWFALAFAQEIFEWKVEACPVILLFFYMDFWFLFSFSTSLAANFGCYQFKIMWSGCADWFESEQTPIFLIGCRVRSAAFKVVRDWFEECQFVLIPYFYSKTNGISEDWVKNWARLCSVYFVQIYETKWNLQTWNLVQIFEIE